MERQLVLASRREIARDDRLELAAESRGFIACLDWFLSGGLDEGVRKMLELPQEIPRAPEEYMPTEWKPPTEDNQ